jgi:hypothetical protein
MTKWSSFSGGTWEYDRYRMTAIGRLQPFDLLDFKKFEGPLSVKAVIQNLAPEIRLANDL